MKEMKKSNRKLQLRVQTYEKKLELQQMKEQQTAVMLEKANEDVERSKLEQETYSKLVNRISLSVEKCLIFADVSRQKSRKRK